MCHSLPSDNQSQKSFCGCNTLGSFGRSAFMDIVVVFSFRKNLYRLSCSVDSFAISSVSMAQKTGFDTVLLAKKLRVRSNLLAPSSETCFVAPKYRDAILACSALESLARAFLFRGSLIWKYLKVSKSSAMLFQQRLRNRGSLIV